MNDDNTKDWPIFRALRGAGGSWRMDVLAGLTLAAIAIPEQMATARLGGFSPHIGFFAFVAGALAFAVFGANRYLSAGADSTITPIFAGSLVLLAASGSPQFVTLAALLALLVGLILIAAGVFRAGWVADLLSIPVMTGFLAGISIHIAVSQLPALLGLPPGSGSFFDRVAQIASHIGQTNALDIAIGLACLIAIILSEKLSPRIPGALIALGAATLAVLFFGLEQRGVGVVGLFPMQPPHPSLPLVGPNDLAKVAGLAFLIALIIMVQTSATSRSFPGPAGESADVNQDFIGLGAGSALSGLFGAFPVNASPPRTAIVFETGGRSQVAGLVGAGAVVIVAAFGADFLAHVPEAALAGILLFVAGRIFRVAAMREIASKTWSEFALVLITMLAVTLLPVQTGVALAIILSLLHGLWTTTHTRLAEYERLPGETVWWPQHPKMKGEKLEGVLVVGYQAPLSFLNIYPFAHDLLAAIRPGLKLIVLEAASVVDIDFTAAGIFKNAIEQCHAKGVDFAIARLESSRAQTALEQFGGLKALGEGRIFYSVDEATKTLAKDARVVTLD